MTSPIAPAAPLEAGASRWRVAAPWLELALQFGAVVYLAGAFRLENRGLYYTLAVAWVAFVGHLVLPQRWRLRWFAAASLGGIALVLGPVPAAWLIGLGASLILLCHVPVRLSVRIVLLLGAGAALATARVARFPGSEAVPGIVWPILGSMFMFRLATYLWSLRHRDAPVGVARAVGYFFMLPNAAFPLFPVIDYKTWVKSWYDTEGLAIAQRGMRWMVRGVVHLLLYRLVYYYVALDPRALEGFRDLLQYVLATFLLYLRVSGQFHLIVGILHLFGFHLPETHKLYFFSSSITDFWRRINIYWKDFMMKLVYLPSFFALRRLGQRPAMLLATLAVFAATWTLHAYQWFWLLGDRLFKTTDLLFWGILGVLATGNALWETRGTRRVIRPTDRWSLALGVRRLVTFATICALWSLWTSDTLGDWLALGRFARPDAPGLLALTLFVIGWLAIAGRPWGAVDLAVARDRARTPDVLEFRTTGVLAVLSLLTVPAVRRALPADSQPVLLSVSSTGPNAADAVREHRGYYEELNNGQRVGMPVWFSALQVRPADWVGLAKTAAILPTGDYLFEELRPGAQVEFHGARLTVNRWGMRGRDYQLAKPPGTFRIAVLGPSTVLGEGVGDHETFSALLEERLNREQAGSTARTFEVLNFAVSGYSQLQQLEQLERKALRFAPDVVLVSGHAQENWLLSRHLRGVLRSGGTIPHPEIDRLVRRIGLRGSTSDAEAERLLRTVENDIYRWTFNRMAADLEEAEAKGVLILLRVPTSPTRPSPQLQRLADSAAFQVIDLTGAYPVAEEETFRVAPWDNHPNAAGHRALADRLYHELKKRDLFPHEGATRREVSRSPGDR